MIKMGDMERFYKQPSMLGDLRARVSCDVAFDGGDSLVMWKWIGNHIEDIFVCKLDSKSTISAVNSKLSDWGILQEDFVYDLQGLGQTFKGFFPKAVPFNNQEAVDASVKNVYANLKSQCAYAFAEDLWNGEVSINPRLLDLKFSGKGFENMPLRQILMKERRCVRRDEGNDGKGFKIVTKDVMKKLVGHSPDFFESLFMKKIFDIKKKKHTKPKGLWRI
jgi:hypothetical protein